MIQLLFLLCIILLLLSYFYISYNSGIEMFSIIYNPATERGFRHIINNNKKMKTYDINPTKNNPKSRKMYTNYKLNNYNLYNLDRISRYCHISGPTKKYCVEIAQDDECSSKIFDNVKCL